MTTIETDDILYVTLIHHGRAYKTMRLTGVDSMGEIISNMRNEVPSLSGMATVDVRNTSRGWSTRNTLYFR